jgi:hypothetical protein
VPNLILEEKIEFIFNHYLVVLFLNYIFFKQYYYDYYEERRGFFAAKKGIGLISIVKEGDLNNEEKK